MSFWKAVAAKERVDRLKAQLVILQQQQQAADAALVAVLQQMDLDLSKPIDFDYEQERVVNADGRPA